MECCLKLSSNLALPNIFPTSFRQNGDERIVSTTLPKLLKGIVIHERRFIRSDLQNNNTTSNMCLECTILGPFGAPLTDFQYELFSLPTIQRFITRGKTNVLICEFEFDEAQALLTSAIPQLSQLSQLSQMSYYLAQSQGTGTIQYGGSQALPPLSENGVNSALPNEQPEAMPIGYGFGSIGRDM